MMTKAEIKKELRELNTMEKTMKICITDSSFRETIIIKMAEKMMSLIVNILHHRKNSETTIEHLQGTYDELNDGIDFEDEHIFFDEDFKVNAIVNRGKTIIEALVLEC